MTYMVTWSVGPEQFKAATARFLQTGGGPPPGVKQIGRWHGAGMGVVIAESDDIKAIYKWTAQWSDFLTFTVTPVMTDAEAAEVFQSVSG